MNIPGRKDFAVKVRAGNILPSGQAIEK